MRDTMLKKSEERLASDLVPKIVAAELEAKVIPTPSTLHPTPCTLHPTPYTPLPTPYTLHHTPFTLQPQPGDLVPKVVAAELAAKVPPSYMKRELN